MNNCQWHELAIIVAHSFFACEIGLKRRDSTHRPLYYYCIWWLWKHYWQN